MGWSMIMKNSYYSTNSANWPKDLASYTNNTGIAIKLKSITLSMGTGLNAFNYDNFKVNDGNGKPIKVKLSVGSSTAQANITHVSESLYQKGHGYTTNRKDLSDYTFTFSSPITINNGASITVSLRIVSATNMGTVLCFNDDPDKNPPGGIIGSETEPVEVTPKYTLTVTRDTISISGVTISGADSSTTVSSSAGLTKHITANPHTGYHFKEWTGFTTTIFSNPYSFTMPNRDLIVKAHGEKNLLTIDPNGGTMIESYNRTTGEKKKTTSPFQVQFVENQHRFLGHFTDGFTKIADAIGEPSRVGYTFSGWFVVSGSGVVNVYNPSAANAPDAIMNDNNLLKGYQPSTSQYYTFYTDEGQNATIQAIWKPNAHIYIYAPENDADTDPWKKAIPYIYNNDKWQQAAPYIYNGSNWKLCGE